MEKIDKKLIAAARSGDAEAQENLGMEYFIRNKNRTALKWFKKSASQGNIHSASM